MHISSSVIDALFELDIFTIHFFHVYTLTTLATVKKLFAQRRKDHIEAVQTLLKMDNYERLYKMITMLAEKVVEVVESSKSVIEKAGFLSKNGSFPEDGGIKDGKVYLQSLVAREDA